MYDVSRIDPIIFQENLRLMRTMSGLTQQQLADYLGCTKQTISNFELKKSGTYKKNVTTMRRYHAIAIFKIFEHINPRQALQFYTMCSH